MEEKDFWFYEVVAKPRLLIETVAEVKNMAVADIAEQIDSNFEGFFNIKLN